MARDIHDGPGGAQETDATATTFPTRHLPPVTYKDMPEPLPLRKVLGPGVIAAGIGLASGEFILWPYITSQVGLVFLWAAIVGVVTQFFINMEIERYTLATGETALTGFSRYWRHWGLFFAVLTFLANAWPGWITSSATLVTFIFGGGNVKLLSILGLASIAIALTMAPVVYTMVERIEFFKVGIILFFIVVAIATAITAEAWGALPDAVTNFGRLPEGLRWPWSCRRSPSPGPGAARTWSRANGCATRATAWASTSPTWPRRSPARRRPPPAPATPSARTSGTCPAGRAGGRWPTRSSWSASWPSPSSPSC